jgi:predicted aspartyl protease
MFVRLFISFRYSIPFLLMSGIIVSLSFYSTLNNLNDRFSGSTIIDASSKPFVLSNDGNPAIPPETDMLTIPLKNAGRLFMIEAIIDNQSGNLIFDTGATGLVMNRTYFRKYVRMESQNSNGINGTVGDVDRINLGRINVSGLSLTNISASLADLGHIENRRGVKVLGLIGFEFFRDYEIVIDASNNEIQLHRIDSRGNRINGTERNFQPDIIQQVDVIKNILFLKGTVGGKVLKFCLDTGAETNAISSDASKAVMRTISLNRKSNLTGAGQKSVEVLFGTMNDFVLGGHQLKNMETIITHLDALNEAYGVQIDGMLGYNFLTKGIICINFTKKQLGMKFLNPE